MCVFPVGFLFDPKLILGSEKWTCFVTVQCVFAGPYHLLCCSWLHSAAAFLCYGRIVFEGSRDLQHIWLLLVFLSDSSISVQRKQKPSLLARIPAGRKLHSKPVSGAVQSRWGEKKLYHCVSVGRWRFLNCRLTASQG